MVFFGFSSPIKNLARIVEKKVCPEGCSVCLCHQKIQPKKLLNRLIQHPDIPIHKVEDIIKKSVRVAKGVARAEESAVSFLHLLEKRVIVN